jgi:ketosteroid isomerase-like protein
MTTKAVELVRAFYDAVARADVPGVVGLLHPDLYWTEAEGFPNYSGTWRHPQDVVDKLLVPLMRDWDYFSAVADDFIAEGDRVVSLGTYAGQGDASALRARVAGRRWQARALQHVHRYATGSPGDEIGAHVMGEVIQFIPKSALERARLIREARAIYESIFPTENGPASQQRDS